MIGIKVTGTANPSYAGPDHYQKVFRDALIPIISLLMCFVFRIANAPAHVIPPEQLHPVADAYRRITFVLNLNPVVWDQVRTDLEVISNYWQQLDYEAANAFRSAVNKVIAQATLESGGKGSDGQLSRRDAVASVFQRITAATAALVQIHLEAAQRRLVDCRAAMKELRQAQGIWGALEITVQAVDPVAYRRLGQAWLGMSGALGNRGLLAHGVVAVDRISFDRYVKVVLSYTKANYGPGFMAISRHKLAPWPAQSPTFLAQAKLPVRLPPGHNINKQIPRPRQILNMTARGVDESETPLIALGDMAFDSAYLFGEPMASLGMSCNNCHNKSITNPDLFIPGLSSRPGTFDVSNSYFAPHANNGVFDPLDVPDLRGIRFTAPYGRNGRIGSLREFVRNVILNEFNGTEPDPMVLDGLVAYMNEFDFLTNPALDKKGRLNQEASASARRGEKVFHQPFTEMGGKSCATCHVPSAHFLDRQSHDIGTVQGYEPNSRDRAMDTPTLLGIKYTAPYFHDGSQDTLRGVVEWFNQSFDLKLTTEELNDLTEYLETVGDGVDAYEGTVYYLDAEMEEFSFFLSAFEFLDNKNKPKLMNMTFQTIALEIRNHKWELRDWSMMPVMERLAQIMDEAYAANLVADQDMVRRKVIEYRKLYAQNVDLLK